MHSGLVLLVVAVLARWQFVLALVTAGLAAVHLWSLVPALVLATPAVKCCLPLAAALEVAACS